MSLHCHAYRGWRAHVRAQFIAVLKDGRVLSWGGNGQFDEGTGPRTETSPVAAASTGLHSVLLLRNGSVRVYGKNDHGEGVIPRVVQQGRVVQVAAGNDITVVSCCCIS
jgi:hypothetical protein